MGLSRENTTPAPLKGGIISTNFQPYSRTFYLSLPNLI